MDLGPASCQMISEKARVDRFSLADRVVGVADFDGRRCGVEPHVGRAEGGPILVVVFADLLGDHGGLAQLAEVFPPVIVSGGGDGSRKQEGPVEGGEGVETTGSDFEFVGCGRRQSVGVLGSTGSEAGLGQSVESHLGHVLSPCLAGHCDSSVSG